MPYQQAESRLRVRATDGRVHRGTVTREASGYILTHAGRQLRVAPIAFWLALVALALMTVWTITTATYFTFREDVLTRLITRQAEMQFGYEDRIAEMRAQVDRISSRQLLDQEQYEDKLEQILHRQNALESRSNALNGLNEAPSSIRPGRAGTGVTEPKLKGVPTNDKGAFLLPRQREVLDARKVIVKSGGIGAVVAQVDASLDRVEQRQATALVSMEENYLSRARRIRGVLAELGVAAGKPQEHATGLGGPFVPPQVPRGANGFERLLQRVSLARIQIHRLTRALQNVPIRRPLEGEVDLASGFGIRQDPFTGSPAMHTGLDIHGEPGDPVRASADGTVTAAGWSGGYGRSVDIDHGNGLSTRYAHLSTIDVRIGQSVRTGQIVGKVGSTGRSTGPHLHYETRVKGEAIDPQKFLRAGARLEGTL